MSIKPEDQKRLSKCGFQSEGQTVLHIASQNGDENMIRTLYLARANATLTDEEGEFSKAKRTFSKYIKFQEVSAKWSLPYKSYTWLVNQQIVFLV